MISDTRIECQNAYSEGEGAGVWSTGSDRGGVEPWSSGSVGLDGFLSWLRQCGSHLPPLRHQPPDVLSLAATVSVRFDHAGGAQPSPGPVPSADVGFSLRRKGFGVAVAVSALGQRQAGGSATPPEVSGFGFYGGPHSHSTEAARPARGTATHRSSGIATRATASPLRRAQTQTVRGV